MTGRQRLTALLDRQPTDRLAWTVIVDAHTLDALPPPLQGVTPLDFCRHLGCDVFSLDGWGTSHVFSSPALEWGEGVEACAWAEGERWIQELRTPRGVLRSEWQRNHPVRYFVQTLDDLRLYRSVWEGARYTARDDAPVFAALDAEIGDQGIITRFWGPSTIPRLLETDFGLTAFYYLLADHPREMDELISLMHEKELQAFRALAEGPWQSVTLVENTSTRYISPEVYRRYNGPHVRDFADIVKGAGKRAILHMCGHLRGLLDQIRKVGADGVHALTPPPTGDTPWELALDVLGEETLLFPVLDPTVFLLGPVEGIGAALDHLYTPRIRRAHTCLTLGADGLVVPLERFEAVARWMERQGCL